MAMRTHDWPDNLRDDGAKLRTAAEIGAIRSIIARIQSGAPFQSTQMVVCECWVHGGAHQRPNWMCCACGEFHQFGDYVQVGGTTLSVFVNLGCAATHDGRWSITYRDTGHFVGGYLDDLMPARRPAPRTAHIHHRDRVYHHPVAEQPQPHQPAARVDQWTLIHRHHAPEHVYLSQAAQAPGAQPGRLTGRVRRKGGGR